MYLQSGQRWYDRRVLHHAATIETDLPGKRKEKYAQEC
jgi:hypothetical protein